MNPREDAKAATPTMPRVLHLIDSGGLYGAEKVILNLASESTALGCHVWVATIVSPDDAHDALGAAAQAIGLQHTQFSMKDGLSFRGLYDILRFAEEHSIQVIHSHGYKANSLLALCPSSRRPCPAICTLHGWTANSRWTKLAVYEQFERFIVRRLDRVVAVSDAIMHRVLRDQHGFVVKIANGIPLPKAIGPRAIDSSLGTQETPAKIVAIGRLSHEKGFDVLISAVAILRGRGIHAHVTIAGEGDLRSELRSMIDASDLNQQITLAGYVSDTSRLYEGADVFVLCSRTEGAPLALLEAISFGVPVVSTAVGEVPRILSGGDYGVLLQTLNADALADGIAATILDRGEAIRRAKCAAAHISNEYSSVAMAREYLAIYLAAIEERNVGRHPRSP